MGKSKYLNKKSHGFDSKLEEKRYEILKLAERQGLITGLTRQYRFTLIEKQTGKYRNERKAEYIADFVYMKDGEMVVEDTKSPYSRKLPAYILKRKMLLKVWNISIREITKDDLYDV